MSEAFRKLVEVMATLRSDQGCPWDKVQTRDTLKPYLIEETYEVLEAIDEDDPKKIREELGDLLLQIVFQAQIAKDAGHFDIDDVAEGITAKMISRHPHVFGDATYDTPEAVVRQWQDRKKEEGKLKESLLEGVPKELPGLLRAHRLQSRASKVGFDWSKTEEVFSKLNEELDEFRSAVASQDKAAIEEELGDVLFVLVNVSRFVGVNAEEALRKSIAKFVRRFRHIERSAKADGRKLEEMTLAEMDALWDEAKRIEKRARQGE
jgi:tetrapyrrole methylase family protein/MazG family protein